MKLHCVGSSAEKTMASGPSEAVASRSNDASAHKWLIFDLWGSSDSPLASGRTSASVKSEPDKEFNITLTTNCYKALSSTVLTSLCIPLETQPYLWLIE